jgi:hypothetical protein
MTTITLEGKEYQFDIEQAKKLNLLKEQDNKVRSWEEFKKKYVESGGYYWSDLYNNLMESDIPVLTKEQLTPHEAKALAAFSKLLKLRRDWIGEWEPDWENGEQKKYVIECIGWGIRTYIQGTYRRNLSFPTQQMAHEFLETFRDLIEEAKILI